MTPVSFFAVAFLCIVLYAVFIETRWVKTEHIVISTEKHIPGGSISILHLSDLHFKKRDAWKTRFLQSLGPHRFDLVLITGDSIDENGGIENFIAAVRALKPAQGVYCVFGNHDYFRYRLRDACVLMFFPWITYEVPIKDVNRLSGALEREGVHILHNRSLTVPDINATLLGVDEYETGRDDVEKASTHVEEGTVNILLAHNPDSVVHAPDRLIDIALAGHTHGGQIRLPFYGALKTQSSLPGNRASGLMFLNGIPTYVSRGLSTFTFMPFRLFCRPEVACITICGTRDCGP
jgi:hypothetical protein